MQLESITKKRKYSKGGCKECKRRKIKCSEEKPACYQCLRLHKQCSYPVEGERVLRVSKKKLESLQKLSLLVPKDQSRNDRNSELVNNATQNNYLEDNEYFATNHPMKMMQNETVRYNNSNKICLDDIHDYQKYSECKSFSQMELTYINLHKDYNSNGTTSNVYRRIRDDINYTEVNYFSGISMENDLVFDLQDLFLLIADANQLMKKVISGYFSSSEIVNTYISNKENSRYAGKVNRHKFPINVSINEVKVSRLCDKLYLEYFYNNFTSNVLPFECYNQSSKISVNPARDLILHYASKVPFLLALVLAQGARIAYKRNHIPEDLKMNREYICTFKHIFTGVLNSIEESLDILSYIELILVTILLLLSESPLGGDTNWYEYLKGTNNIFSKAKGIKIQNPETILFCKSWLISIVLSAGFNMNIGNLPNPWWDLLIPGDEYEILVLKDIGVINKFGINVLWGFKNETIPLFKEIIRILNRKDGLVNSNSVYSSDSLKLLFQFYESSKEPNKDSSIFELQENSYAKYTIPNSYDNWMALSHKVYTLAAILVILKEGSRHSYQSYIIQNIITEIIKQLYFLDYTTEITSHLGNFLVIIQWPMTIAGLNCTEENNLLLLIRFFRILSDRGCENAAIWLKKIYEKGINQSY